MAGLVCAARARELGARPVVFEKGNRPGGSMLLSSCVIWRYRSAEAFREECPGGDPALQRLIVERLDDALAWLESLGGPVTQRETGNPRTIGMRFDPRGLTDALVRAAGDVRLSEGCNRLLQGRMGRSCSPPAASRGSAELVSRYVTPEALPLRANPWSAGDGLVAGSAAGGALSTGMDEFYGRNMPDAPFGEADFVPLAQLYAAQATVVDERGEPFLGGPPTWSETDVVQATARQPGARAWYLLDDEALADENVRTRVERARAARRAGRRRRPTCRSRRHPAPSLGVHVRAAITHTMGGLRVDEPRARPARGRLTGRRPVRRRRRRRRHLDRRLLERARAGARARPRGRRARRRLTV